MNVSNADQFQAEIDNADGKQVVVDFWATWCGPCLRMTPVLEELSLRDDVKVIKVDVDENPDLAQKFHITSIPTLRFWKDGKENKAVIRGVASGHNLLTHVGLA